MPEDTMAIEYTYYGAADLDTDGLRSLVASALGARLSPDGSMFRDGLWVNAYRVEPAETATAPRLFGFEHRVTVTFRFSSVHPELEQHNTALMVGVVLALSGADGVLLFNGEEAVVQTSGGVVTFAAGWEDWDEPEVAALMSDHRVAPLAQPLL
jgi:hypothetical protein